MLHEGQPLQFWRLGTALILPSQGSTKLKAECSGIAATLKAAGCLTCVLL